MGAAHQSHERQGSFWQGLVRQLQQQQQEGQSSSVALQLQSGHLHAAQTLSSAAADCAGASPAHYPVPQPLEQAPAQAPARPRSSSRCLASPRWINPCTLHRYHHPSHR